MISILNQIGVSTSLLQCLQYTGCPEIRESKYHSKEVFKKLSKKLYIHFYFK